PCSSSASSSRSSREWPPARVSCIATPSPCGWLTEGDDMAPTTDIDWDKDHLLLDHVSWERYERLLDETSHRRLRITYCDGRLEIISVAEFSQASPWTRSRRSSSSIA